MGDLIVSILESDEMADLIELSFAPDPQAARASVDSQHAQVAIIIPPDFSEQFADIEKGKAVIEFYQDPTLTIGPAIMKSIMNRFLNGMAGVKIAVNVFMDEADSSKYVLTGQVVEQYLDTSLALSEDLEGELLDVRAPASSPQSKSEESQNLLLSIVGPIMAGMMIFYAFFTGASTAQSILKEEEERTLPRLFTTPIKQSTILSGKFLAVFLTVFVQFIVLLVAGRLIFQIQWGGLAALGLLVVSVVVVASSFGIFTNSFLKDTKQGGIVFGGVLTLTGMIGMMRIFTMGVASPPPMLSTITLLVPQGWAIRGLLQVMDGALISDVALSVLVMFTWAALFFVIGIWRFNRRYV